MHFEAYRWVWEQMRGRPAPDLVLDLGSYAVNGTARALVPRSRYVGVDIRPGPGVDVVCDAGAHELPQLVGGPRFDVVFSMETLEHAEVGAEIIANAFACLRPGGRFYVTAAGPARPVHSSNGGPELASGEFYRNVPVMLLLGWLQAAGFRAFAVEYGRDQADIYGTGVRAK